MTGHFERRTILGYQAIADGEDGPLRERSFLSLKAAEAWASSERVVPFYTDAETTLRGDGVPRSLRVRTEF